MERPFSSKGLGSVAALAIGASLCGCVAAPIGPTVQVLPGPGKTDVAFANDQTACRGTAQQQTATEKAAIQQQVVGSILNGGLDPGTSNTDPNGTYSGSLANAGQATLQQDFDNAYVHCMLSLGDVLPGQQPSPDVASGPDPAMVAAVQRQLIRTGFLHDSADGAMGPKTERAITAFQRANGLPVDGEPSSALLASLREQPSVEAPTAAASPAPSNAPQWETPGAAPGSASGGGAQPWATPAAAPAATANAPAVTAGSSQWSVPATAPAAAGTASP